MRPETNKRTTVEYIDNAVYQLRNEQKYLGEQYANECKDAELEAKREETELSDADKYDRWTFERVSSVNSLIIRDLLMLRELLEVERLINKFRN